MPELIKISLAINYLRGVSSLIRIPDRARSFFFFNGEFVIIFKQESIELLVVCRQLSSLPAGRAKYFIEF